MKLGFNLYNETSSATHGCGPQYSDAILASQEIGMMSFAGASVQRFWAFAEFGMAAVERAVAANAKQGIRSILVLADQWGNCESNGYKTVDWYTTPAKRPTYDAWVKSVATAFKDDPRIYFIELINEAEAKLIEGGACAPNGTQALRSFMDEQGAVIKAIDPARKVTLGVIGPYQCGLAGGGYEAVHASPVCDYLTHHHYPGTNAAALASTVAGVAKRLGKPWLVDEVGMALSKGLTEAQRAQYFDACFNAYYYNGAEAALIWNRGNTSSSFDVGPLDPANDVMLKWSQCGVVSDRVQELQQRVQDRDS